MSVFSESLCMSALLSVCLLVYQVTCLAFRVFVHYLPVVYPFLSACLLVCFVHHSVNKAVNLFFLLIYLNAFLLFYPYPCLFARSSVSQSVSQSAGQSVSPIRRYVGQSVTQPISRLVSQSVIQSLSHSVS